MSDFDGVYERADECRREAARATNAADVLAWLSLADEWRRLAQTSDSDLGTPRRADETASAFI
jgi:hypothetical protein